MWQPITQHELQELSWIETEAGWWRIVADLTCGVCGAYQAADCDPTNDKQKTLQLCVRLFNSVGWRVDGTGKVHCLDCAR